jgi:hypothetical protein
VQSAVSNHISIKLGDKEPGDMGTMRGADLTNMSVYRAAR